MSDREERIVYIILVVSFVAWFILMTDFVLRNIH